MPNRAYIIEDAPGFIGREPPCEGWLVGYGAVIAAWGLKVPVPERLGFVADNYRATKSEAWSVFPRSYRPNATEGQNKVEELYHQLVFALKYEGVNLAVFAALRKVLGEGELLDLVNIEPLGQYARRIWFLLEWVDGQPIAGKEPVKKKGYVAVLDERLQFGVAGVKSPRHAVVNNLPGTPQFCPLIFKTERLVRAVAWDSSGAYAEAVRGVEPDSVRRAAAFLLLKESRASFAIEGERPKEARAARWGTAIGEAGRNPLTVAELIRLQRLVLEPGRFVHYGFREAGGFVGEHDPWTGTPLPEHISARPADINGLIDGLIATDRLLADRGFHPVLAAATVAWGFVIIHPFGDGNGRIHRFLVHHVLARRQFPAEGAIFPISSSISDQMGAYRYSLQAISQPALACIDWEETPDHNIHVTNDTADLYRFFDATAPAEFLAACIEDALLHRVPRELAYLADFDAFRKRVLHRLPLPERLISLLVKFLTSNHGRLSARARAREFKDLTAAECDAIEAAFAATFGAR